MRQSLVCLCVAWSPILAWGLVVAPSPRLAARGMQLRSRPGASGAEVAGGASEEEDVVVVSRGGGGPGGIGALSEPQVLGLVGLVVMSLVGALRATRLGAPPPWMALREVLAGGLAAAATEVSLYPIEVFKVRRQISTASKKQGAPSPFTTAGLVAGICRALVYHGLRLGLFPTVKLKLGATTLASKMAAGAACGALGAAVCNPLDLVETRGGDSTSLQRGWSRSNAREKTTARFDLAPGASQGPKMAGKRSRYEVFESWPCLALALRRSRRGSSPTRSATPTPSPPSGPSSARGASGASSSAPPRPSSAPPRVRRPSSRRTTRGRRR